MNDTDMPEGWRTIKSVLLEEMCDASNFHHIRKAADALFHARLLGEGIEKELRQLCSGKQTQQLVNGMQASKLKVKK